MCISCPTMFRRWVREFYNDDSSGKSARRTHEEIVLEKEAKQKAVAGRKEFHAKKRGIKITGNMRANGVIGDIFKK